MAGDKGSVYLVGAGCGEADLITVRGSELIASCDVLCHDSLISKELLDLAVNAEKIDVGKRMGRQSASQEEICRLLIEKAREGKCVVRLKGGDPFVFGRGGEEALALKEAGVPFSIVPGISSAIAIPEMAGIPVTHRGLSRGFHVVTAHMGDSDELPEELRLLAPFKSTLIILMGLSKLESIAEKLIQWGRGPDTPAAVISGGNAPKHACVRGSLTDIAALTRMAGVEPPAVIVVGETAALELI